MRDWQDTLGWYASHTTENDLGFNPDGMCLKICRTARDIGSKYMTAKQCQDAVPKKYRVTKIADLRKGMNLFFDDPNDSNKAGHIVTMLGRVKGADPDSLHDVLVGTNSVISGRLVVVRGDYFTEHWGDPFQFGAAWINGVPTDIPSGNTRVKKFKAGGPRYDVKLLDDSIHAGRHDVKASRDRIDELVKSLPKDTGTNNRVDRFVTYYKHTRILHMGLLKNAVDSGRHGSVEKIFKELHEAIDSVPAR